MAQGNPRLRLDIYPHQALLDALDRWRNQQLGSPMNRADAVRRIVDERLIAEGCYELPETRANG